MTSVFSHQFLYTVYETRYCFRHIEVLAELKTVVSCLHLIYDVKDMNAVCAIFIPTVNQAKCCGINSNPVKNACYWRTIEVVSSE